MHRRSVNLRQWGKNGTLRGRQRPEGTHPPLLEGGKMSDTPYDLCVIGAGYAGINALFAASQHLRRGARVLVIDRHREIGGMWLTTYPFVRLHQPYAFFTFGSATWALKKPRTHLASRDEILDHFRHTVARLQGRLQIDFAFETIYNGHEPHDEAITVRFSALGDEEATRQARTQKLIVAIGADIQPRSSLTFTSKQVRSISPNQLAQITAEAHAAPVPVYIMGSGKTAMDCAHWLQKAPTSTRLTLIAGRGALFRNRDVIFPPSIFQRLFFGGVMPSDAILEDFIRPWDGTNTDAVLANLRAQKKLISLVPDAENYQAGLISMAELDVIAEGLGSRIIRGHIADVVDEDGEPTLVLRDGSRRRVERGAVVVNCTGHFVDQPLNQAPILSPCGRILTTAFYLGLSGPSAGLLTHAFCTGRLREVSDRLFVNAIGGEPKAEVPFRNFLGAMANGLMLLPILPRMVLLTNRADMMRWYPIHRRLLSALRMMRSRTMILDKADRLLR